MRGTSSAFARAHPHLRPALTFVDGDHSRAGVEARPRRPAPLVPAGGTLVFHDFDDPRNDDPSCVEIKVRPAVESSWVSRDCELERVTGACGVFVRRRVAPAPRRTAADLSPLHDLRDLWRYRVRLPAGRVWRRRAALAASYVAGMDRTRIEDLDTPCLVVDLRLFEANVALLHGASGRRGCASASEDGQEPGGRPLAARCRRGRRVRGKARRGRGHARGRDRRRDGHYRARRPGQAAPAGGAARSGGPRHRSGSSSTRGRERRGSTPRWRSRSRR